MLLNFFKQEMFVTSWQLKAECIQNISNFSDVCKTRLFEFKLWFQLVIVQLGMTVQPEISKNNWKKYLEGNKPKIIDL